MRIGFQGTSESARVAEPEPEPATGTTFGLLPGALMPMTCSRLYPFDGECWLFGVGQASFWKSSWSTPEGAGVPPVPPTSETLKPVSTYWSLPARSVHRNAERRRVYSSGCSSAERISFNDCV